MTDFQLEQAALQVHRAFHTNLYIDHLPMSLHSAHLLRRQPTVNLYCTGPLHIIPNEQLG